MDSNLSLYEENLKFYFLVEKSKSSKDIAFAREKLKENVAPRNIFDVTSVECLKLAESILTVKDIFVFDQFSDECFERVSQTEALVLGPRCVISCFMDNVSVPNVKSPIFSLTMRDLLICLSSLTPNEKRHLKKLIGFMGGRCIDELTENVTHLVTDSVMSKKYEQAAIQRMKIMKPDWVLNVWKLSSTENVVAINECFDKYQLPIFNKLTITTTGLKEKVKSEVKKMIETNGGNYCGEFSSSVINILIVDKVPKESQKLKAAITSKKECLTYDWVFDSVEKGFALPIDGYKLMHKTKPVASTPEKMQRSTASNNHFNYTDMSVMSNVSYSNVINETAVSNVSVMSNRCEADGEKETQYKTIFAKLNVLEAKKVGTFLDGCSIFVCGFTNDEKDKIVKILNSGGATRYDIINSNVSHILIGNPTKKDIAILQAKATDGVMLKLDWLLESILKKQAISEYTRFLYHLPSGKSKDVADESASAPSPASKRNILSMSGSVAKQSNRKRLDFQSGDEANNANKISSDESPKERVANANKNLENQIIDQYLNASVNKALFKKPNAVAVATKKNAPDVVTNVERTLQPIDQSSSSFDSEYSLTFSENVNFLNNLTVNIQGFDDESQESLILDCKTAGADVIIDNNYSGVVDYLILAMDILTTNGITIKAKNIVNHNWLINSKKINKISDILYFYKPIIFSEDLKPLANMTIVFSLYSGDERRFLEQLANIFGAEVHDIYRRSSRPLLICPLPDSAKYVAAINWNLPVVTCQWLLECYKREKRIPLKNFLVGDSISPVDDIADEASEVVDQLEILDEPEADENQCNIEPNLDGTPIITNRRVAALRSGITTAKDNFSPRAIEAEYKENLLNSLDTPVRERVRELVENIQIATPETKRRRREENDPYSTPEFLRTPYLKEQKRAFLEERRQKYMPKESEVKKKSTPWTEHKRKFWKNILGDEYESPSDCYNVQTQAFTQLDETAGTSRQLTYESSCDLEADINIRKLTDFINNRDNDSSVMNRSALPDTAPHMTEIEMPNTELPEIVGWRDPSEIILSSSSKKKDGMKFIGTPCFSISCANDEIKLKIISQIKMLKGRVCDNLINYDKSCTHFLCERPNRAEKTYCCISAGKWVLGIDYIQKSIDAGYFLDEELFEWGNPAAIFCAELDQKNETSQAVYRWRKQVAETGNGAFKDFCVILKTRRNENLRNLIEAGHGKVLTINNNKPLSEQKDLLTKATHLICQPKVTDLSSDDQRALKETNVICVTMTYLNACLITEQPDPKLYLYK